MLWINTRLLLRYSLAQDVEKVGVVADVTLNLAQVLQHAVSRRIGVNLQLLQVV